MTKPNRSDLHFIAAPTLVDADRFARDHGFERWKFVRDLKSVHGYRPPYIIHTLSFGPGLTRQQLEAIRYLDATSQIQTP